MFKPRRSTRRDSSANLRQLYYTLSAGFAAALLAGCGGSQPLTSVPAGLSVGNRAAAASPEYKISTPLVYVTSFVDSSVKVYRATALNPEPVAMITRGVDQPNGDCIDAQGTLYVVNSPNSVSEYAIGKTEPSKTITEGLYGPGSCAIDSRGNLWVTNLGGHYSFVRRYRPGAIEPDGVIRNGLTSPVGIAIDHKGNIYVANLQPYGTSNVQVYPPRSNSPSRTITDGIHWPVGLGVDAKGTLYVTNDAPPCNIEEYRVGQSHPYRTITDEINGPTAATFGKDGWLYITNSGSQGCSGPGNVILEFPPNSLKSSKREIRKDLYGIVGNAVYPPLLP